MQTYEIPQSRKCLAAFAAVLLLLSARQIPALTIVRDFVGGTPGTNDIGTGNLVDIFNVAAGIWELAIQDEHVLTLHYGWSPVGGGEHSLDAQGGVPNRETEGTILFNSDNVAGHIHFYLDPTPWDNAEYSSYTDAVVDLGGGALSAARYFSGATGDAASFGHVDLLMVALHEIGHALGISSANQSFISESIDSDIDVMAPLPFAGTTIELATNFFGVTSHIDFDQRGTFIYGTLMSGNNPQERRLPSSLDILANAQLSQFRKLNLTLAPNLNIQLQGTNVIVAWMQVRAGFVLEENTDPKQTNAWVSVQQHAGVSNGLYTVKLPATVGQKFYRLRKP